MTNKSEHTLSKRYFAKLIAQFLNIILTFIIQAIVPRSLGPTHYGNYSFLQDYFNKIIGFIDVGTSTAFYAKISQRKNEFSLISFYFRLLFIIFFIVIGFTLSVCLFNWNPIVFPDQEKLYIVMAAFMTCIFFLNEIFFKIADAYGLTVFSEKIRIFSRIINVILIVMLFIVNKLSLFSFYVTQYIQYGIIIFAQLLLLGKNGKSFFKESWSLDKKQLQTYLLEFYIYSKPLLLLSFFGTIAGILERLILQKFAGSTGQGFYGLSYTIGQICFLFTSSMTPLFMREISISFISNQIHKIKESFSRLAPILFLIGSFFACFIAINSEFVVILLGGKNFEGAALSLTIMSYYPIHQTYGQLTASVFFATNDTKKYSIIGFASTFVGLALTYFVLAPLSNGGLAMGSAGLAMKMVVVQFLAVNINLIVISRKYEIGYFNLLIHQIFCIFYFTTSAYLIKVIFAIIIKNEFVLFFTGGLFYTMLSCLLTISFPVIFGISKNDRDAIYKKTKYLLSRK